MNPEYFQQCCCKNCPSSCIYVSKVPARMTTGLRPNERIETKILLLRGKKVMLDRYLADRHGVAIKVLKQAVHRNTERFPDGFAFVRDNQEATNKL